MPTDVQAELEERAKEKDRKLRIGLRKMYDDMRKTEPGLTPQQFLDRIQGKAPVPTPTPGRPVPTLARPPAPTPEPSGPTGTVDTGFLRGKLQPPPPLVPVEKAQAFAYTAPPELSVARRELPLQEAVTGAYSEEAFQRGINPSQVLQERMGKRLPLLGTVRRSPHLALGEPQLREQVRRDYEAYKRVDPTLTFEEFVQARQGRIPEGRTGTTEEAFFDPSVPKPVSAPRTDEPTSRPIPIYAPPQTRPTGFLGIGAEMLAAGSTPLLPERLGPVSVPEFIRYLSSPLGISTVAAPYTALKNVPLIGMRGVGLGTAASLETGAVVGATAAGEMEFLPGEKWQRELAGALVGGVSGTGLARQFYGPNLRNLTSPPTDWMLAEEAAKAERDVFNRVAFGAGHTEAPRAGRYFRPYPEFEERVSPTAAKVLADVARGERPSTVTPELARAASENDVPVTKSTTPDQIVEALKEKAAEPRTLLADLNTKVRNLQTEATRLRTEKLRATNALTSVQTQGDDAARNAAGELLAKTTSALSRTRRQLNIALKQQKLVRIRAEAQDLLDEMVTRYGADEATARIVARWDEATKRLLQGADLSVNATGLALRQRLGHTAAAISGNVPGPVSKLFGERNSLYEALLHHTEKATNDLANQVNKAVKKEIKVLVDSFTGPDELKPFLRSHGGVAFWHHPDWFPTASKELLALHEQSQTFMLAQLKVAEALGYPIKAIAGPYLEIVWDMPTKQAASVIKRGVSLVSPARERIFGDFAAGIKAGYKPADMNVGDLIRRHSALMQHATADAAMRRALLAKWGVPIKGQATIPVHPEYGPYSRFGTDLYEGWAAPEAIVTPLNSLYDPPPEALRWLSGTASRFKNTAFGTTDLAVFGVQIPLTLATGGPSIALGRSALAYNAVARWVNRSLDFLWDLPLVPLYDDASYSRMIDAGLSGLHLAPDIGITTLRKGTIIGVLGPPGKLLDKPISAFVDYSAKIQFGTILTRVRLMAYEGNLVALHLTGNDITDPAVRRIAAKAANNMTGAGGIAQTAGRRSLEQTALTSVQMTRAQFGLMNQVAKGLGPEASHAERTIAALTLANFGVMVYGLGSLFNRALGNGPMEFNPAKPDWASIRVGNTVIPLIPGRTLPRAIARSFEYIIETVTNPEERDALLNLGNLWLNFATSKLNPLARLPLTAAGTGYDPDRGWVGFGELQGKGLLLNIAPLPPFVTSMFTDKAARTPGGAFMQFLGFNIFEDSASSQLFRAIKSRLGIQDVSKMVPSDWARARALPEYDAFIKEAEKREKAGDEEAGFIVASHEMYTEREKEFQTVIANSRNDDRTINWDKLADGVYSVLSEYGTALKQLEADRTRLFGERPEPQIELQAQLDEYFARNEAIAVARRTQEWDLADSLSQDLDRWLESVGPDRIYNQIGLRFPPEVRQVLADQRKIGAYYDAREAIFKDVAAEFGITADTWHKALEEEIQKARVRIANSTSPPRDEDNLTLLARKQGEANLKTLRRVWDRKVLQWLKDPANAETLDLLLKYSVRTAMELIQLSEARS